MSSFLTRSINLPLKLFYSDLKKDYNATIELADGIKSEIENPFRRFLCDQTDLAVTLFSEAKALKQYFEQCCSLLDESKEEFFSCCVRIENAIKNIQKLAKDLRCESLVTSKERNLYKEKQTKERLEHAFVLQVEETNVLRETYVSRTKEIYSKFEELALIGASKVKEVLQKLQDAQRIYTQQVKVDMEKRTDIFNEISAEKDVELFLVMNKTNKLPSLKFEFEPYERSKLGKNLEDEVKDRTVLKELKEFAHVTFLRKEEVVGRLEKTCLSTELELINQKSWEGKTLTAAETYLFEKYMEDLRYRLSFLYMFNKHRVSGKFEMSAESFEIVANLMQVIVGKVEKEGTLDYETVRMILILSQTFFKYEGETKVFLQEPIEKLELFESKWLWVELLLREKLNREFDGRQRGECNRSGNSYSIFRVHNVLIFDEEEKNIRSNKGGL